MQRLGQHFLKNNTVIEAIIKAADVRPGEHVIEVGPGHGELTIPLANLCAELGSQFITIEKDVALAADLEKRLPPNTTLIRGDVRKELKNVTSNLHGPYIILGNIPYYLTNFLLRLIEELPKGPDRMVFTIQKEVAERIVAKPPHMNKLAASIAYWADSKILRTVPKTDFRPVPAVDSAIIVLHAKKILATPRKPYYQALKTIFAQPRKTIINNLSAPKNAPRELLRNVLEKLEIHPEDRPQNLSAEQIALIAEKLFLNID